MVAPSSPTTISRAGSRAPQAITVPTMAFDHLDPAFRRFVSYIDKSREFYQASGYDRPYRWASNEETPFTALSKPMSESRVGIVTTSFPHRENVALEPGDPPLSKDAYVAPSSPVPERMFTDDLSWHKEATHTDDVESFLPLGLLTETEGSGRIGAASPRFYGVPTEYSQRKTGIDAKTIEQWCREDALDVVLLIPL